MSRLRERLYKEYELEKNNYDFMGYTFKDKRELSTHHIKPRFLGGETKHNNLCILNRNTSHNYIHLIQDYDYKVFLQISKCLIQQVQLGKIDINELNKIDELLSFFEEKFKDEETKNGNLLIKPEYKTKRIIKNLQ